MHHSSPLSPFPPLFTWSRPTDFRFIIYLSQEFILFGRGGALGKRELGGVGELLYVLPQPAVAIQAAIGDANEITNSVATTC
jgi:hypothetical protein